MEVSTRCVSPYPKYCVNNIPKTKQVELVNSSEVFRASYFILWFYMYLIVNKTVNFFYEINFYSGSSL